VATRLRAEHALIRGLREGGSETELTRAFASVLDVEPRMTSEFLRLVVRAAPYGDRIDLSDLPVELRCSAEERVAEGRADLTLYDPERRWHAIVEIKLYAGYGTDQIHRYLRSFHPTAKWRALVAITRNVPYHGEDADDPCWAGSVRWARLLPALRMLRPSNDALAAQWPLFLDVLEEEGSMGFTNAKPELFEAWARFPDARGHMIDFVDSIREALLDALREELLRPGNGTMARQELAGFAGRGRKQDRVISPALGKVVAGFKVPAGVRPNKLRTDSPKRNPRPRARFGRRDRRRHTDLKLPRPEVWSSEQVPLHQIHDA
jgi:hypothetical protein